MSRDWVRWHDGYDDPASSLRARLALVQRRLSDAIATAKPGPLRLLSLCAGQGHDVLGVLPGHPRRADVSAVLVELDQHNARRAAQRAAAAGLAGVVIRQADAGVVAGYADAVPADVLMLCGIFGNVSDADIQRTIAAAPVLCAPGGTVIWTRHRRPPDATPRLRAWFAQAGFDELAFDSPDARGIGSVGVHRLPAGPAHAERAAPRAWPPTEPLFTFAAPADMPTHLADPADPA